MSIPLISLIAMIFSALSVTTALAMFFLVLWQAPHELDNRLTAIYMATVCFWGISSFLTRFAPLLERDPTLPFFGIALGIGFAGLAFYSLVSHYAGLWKQRFVPASIVAGLIFYLIMIPFLLRGQLYNEIEITAGGNLRYHFELLGYVTFVISYTFYLITLFILIRFRTERAGNLLVGGVILALGVLTSLSSTFSQYSVAISSAAIATILFARAILQENLFYPLARLNNELETANHRLTALTEDLRVANEQLTEVNQLKSHFLANMSHELRTPLNSILGYTEMLSDGVYGDLNEKQFDRLSRVTRNGHHLLQLINDILDLSKIEAGKMELDVESVDLNEILNECMAIIEPMAQKKKLALDRQIVEDLPPMLADRNRAAQILMNLLSNAVKFTSSGTVSVRAQSINDPKKANLPQDVQANRAWMLIAVEDTGIGIAPENQQLIFDEFRQADDSPSRQYEGTGLGLAITRKLVELMDGHIWLESMPGKGSTFQIVLPLASTTTIFQ